MNQKIFDITIIGAGLTGLLAASTFSRLGLSIAVVDKGDFFNKKMINFDFRTTAIAEGSKIFLESINLWNKLKIYGEPIKIIKVIDREEKNKINFNNNKKPFYLGYIVENKHIKNILIKEIIKKKNVKFFNKSHLNEIVQSNDYVESVINNKSIKSKILIAADGKNSFVRSLVKTSFFQKKYNSKALVVNVCHSQNHQNTAYELFF